MFNKHTSGNLENNLRIVNKNGSEAAETLFLLGHGGT
jgi:hypothetical protein